MAAAALSKPEEKITKAIKKLLEALGPLPDRISELLEQHRGRRRTGAAAAAAAADDPQLRSLEFIQAELSGMVASLGELQSSELGPDYVDNDDFKKWLRALSLVAPEIRDYLEKSEQAARLGCHAQLHRAAAYCFLRAAGLPLPFLRGVKAMEETMSDVAERPFRYTHLLLADDDAARAAAEQLHLHTDDGNLVGIEEGLRNKVISRFMDDGDGNKNLSLISIVGQAGVGKTTLAKVIFKKLQEKEHCATTTAKVEVSQRPHTKEIVIRSIFSQIGLGGEQNLILVVDDIKRDIKAYLQDKRYLIVLDGLWKKTDWDGIKDVFPQNNLGSRIIVTTNLQSVAEYCCLIDGYCLGEVHEVSPMSERDSKILLFGKTFDSEVSCPNHLQQVCCEILKRCGGIPLFISGMADWLKEEQLDHEELKLSPMLKQFERTLSAAYDGLPYWLKVQLLYINMFPEGYVLKKKSFNDKLRAELLLVESSEIAEDYFLELIDRNIITQVKNSQVEEEESCHWQVNYFMLQFLASKSAEKGFVYTSGTITLVPGAASESSSGGGGGKKPRRLSLHQPDSQLPEHLAEMSLSHTRSLAVSGEVDGIPLDKFICLMVLDLEGWQRFKEQDWLPICKMFLLRYLSLRGVNTGASKVSPKIKDLCKLETLDLSHTQITELPSQVCELSELRVFDLRGTPVKRLPDKIRKMRQLRHLLLGGNGVDPLDTTVTTVPEEIGYLHDLDTLTIDLSGCSASLLEGLVGIWKLKVLAITLSLEQSTDRKFQEALCSSIGKWKLESLSIHCGLGCSMEFFGSESSGQFSLSDSLKKFKVTGGRFLNLPTRLGGLGHLVSIEITVYKLVEGDLSTLGNLGSLEGLVLGLYLLPEEEIVIQGGTRLFGNLKRLSVGCRVPWISFKQRAMPRLRYLELNIGGSPASDKSIPLGIANLESLSEVVLNYKKCYDDSPNVRSIIEAVTKGVNEHHKMINLIINGQLQTEHNIVKENR
ncbi:putative inactive disease susceptibility protein LOV1 [Brachypodium distachyon]|uniref:putative inactive disease susceptibility protein LOV1 n=1 Tax=Brachypodium distachyon TaxID=15368 RepID=UPI0001C70A5F|nr:putative inactive disease susceptibility protein LOV1 [Brachypodium distachyon]|eukprot:XP_003575921.1 putative inactive disease susceptibility protein LOV1 [Brachypodium distachyon]